METTIQAPEELSEFDFWELEAWDSKIRSEGRDYAWENYPPQFEFASYQPVDREVAEGMLRQYRPAIEAAWCADGDAACAKHNAHVDEARRRAEHRALWAVRFANGNVGTVEDETHARWMYRDPSWNVAALLTRDEPGGEWREVTEAVA